MNSNSSSKFPTLPTINTPHREPCWKSEGPELYQAILNYHDLTMLPDLKAYNLDIKKFLQQISYHALFIFGPSGCGKHLLVKNHLEKNRIVYKEREEQIVENRESTEMDDDKKQYRVRNIREQLDELLDQDYATKVDYFSEFPFTSLETSEQELAKNIQFKKRFFTQIERAKCKLIFVLNTDMYNSYYILPKDLPASVMVITFRTFTNAQVKTVVKDFGESFPVFRSIIKDKDEMDEILQLSNGDVRKAFLNIYKNYIVLASRNAKQSAFCETSTLVDRKMKVKNQKKFPLFHLLGKYLYAKRYDEKTKTNRYFSRQELHHCDPPFYFDPAETFNRSFIPLTIFTELLFQNFLLLFVNLHDAREAYEVFVNLETSFPSYIGNKRINSDSETSKQLYILLLTWGIILKNKSSSEVRKKFHKFRKSNSIHFNREIKQKRDLLRKYFKHRSLSFMMKFGHMVRNSRCTKKYLISSLLVRNRGGIRNIADENGKIDEAGENLVTQQNAIGVNENQIRVFIEKKKEQKKIEEQILALQDEGMSESDIDEEN